MTNPARMYRESAVRGASPVGLIVILYEEVVRLLRQAQRGIGENDIERRILSLNQAIRIIGHLQAILNFEAGGGVARHLASFYNAARTAILDANATANASILSSLAASFSDLAGAWQQVDRALARPENGPAGSVPHASPHLSSSLQQRFGAER